MVEPKLYGTAAIWGYAEFEQSIAKREGIEKVESYSWNTPQTPPARDAVEFLGPTERRSMTAVSDDYAAAIMRAVTVQSRTCTLSASRRTIARLF